METQDNNTAKKTKILIMDDEEFIVEILEEMIDMMGYQAVSASEGDSALKLLEGSAAEQDLIKICILDLTIPGGKGGLEIIEDIKKISGKITAIAASGYSNKPVMSDPVKYGFTDILQKPFKYDDVFNIIKKYTV